MIHVKFDNDSYSKDSINHYGSVLDELITFSWPKSLDYDDHVTVVPSVSSIHDPNYSLFFTCPNFEVLVVDDVSPHPETEIPTNDNTTSSNQFTLHDVRDHPLSPVIRDPTIGVPTHRQASSNLCMFVNFVSLFEPKNINYADCIRAMQHELHEFKRHKVWTLIPCPQGKKIVCTCWVFRNRLDEDIIITINKARLVAQGFIELDGLDYDEKVSLVACLGATRLFLAYVSFMNFKVFQMDVKTAFLHRVIK